MLVSMGVCPFCDGGHNTPCFATFDDGYKCYTCGVYKSTDMPFLISEPRIPKNNRHLEIEFNPKKFTVDALKWLYQYYISDVEIRYWGIGQLADGRLYFGISNFYQLRDLEKKGFKTHGVKTNLILSNMKTDTLIFVEDYISAIRLSSIADVYCLFGTSLPKTEPLPDYSNYIVWLDGDDAGQTAASILITRLQKELYQKNTKQAYSDTGCYTIRQIITDKDPKKYTNQELKQYISEGK